MPHEGQIIYFGEMKAGLSDAKRLKIPVIIINN
jgi:hypothetical protein